MISWDYFTSQQQRYTGEKNIFNHLAVTEIQKVKPEVKYSYTTSESTAPNMRDINALLHTPQQESSSLTLPFYQSHLTI